MWEKEIDIARQAAEEAGKILTGLFGQVKRIEKKGKIDLVTEADLQSEKAILDIIGRTFPQDSILSEEAGEENRASGLSRASRSSDRTWIIDPLDGTTNFIHGFSFFAVSIALEAEKRGVLGVVYNPYTREHFEAVKGMGAFLNNKRIHVSQTRRLQEALLATGFPYDVHENPHGVMKRLQEMVVRAQDIRRAGSAAMDLCYVAAGILDGFWEEGLQPWDTAAAAVIVREAGGKISTFENDSYTPYLSSIIAANPFVHKAMIKVLNAR